MRSPVTVAITLAASAALLLALAVPALAKEGLEARLDAPIARGTPGGTELEVGMTVTVLDGDVMRPVEGSPIYLKLVGPDGSETWQLGREGPRTGHYTMRIQVPVTGISQVEVGIHGTSDLPIAIVGDALVAGGITSATAQLAPPAAAVLTPLPRASAPAPAPATGAQPATAATGDQGGIPAAWLALLGIAAVAAAGGALVALARRPRGTRTPAPDAHRAPGT